MSIFNTLAASRTAIDLFSDRLEIIGGNIASTHIPGFDRQRQVTTDNFYQQLSQQSTVSGTAHGGGVRETGRQTIFTTGALNRTGQATDIAIDGRGWLPVQDEATGQFALTRVGSFDLDQDGFLKLAGGQKLLGIQGVDPRFQVSLDALNNLVFKVDPAVANALPGTSGSALQLDWAGADWSDGGLSFAPTAPTGGQAFPVLSDGSLLTASTLNSALGSLNGGTGLELGVRFTSFAATERAIGQGAISETAADEALLLGTNGAGLAVGAASFTSHAALRAAIDEGSITMSEVDTALGTALPEGLAPAIDSFDRLSAGVKAGLFSEAEINAALSNTPLALGGQSFDGTEGKTWSDLEELLPVNPRTGQPYTLAEIASAAPRALGLEVQADGAVNWNFSNGESAPAAWLRLAEVRDPGALEPIGESLFAPTDAAFLLGDWQQNTPGLNGRGALIGGSLELSNVDLTTEFGDLLASQRSYQANSKMLSVMDDLLNKLTQLT